MVRSIGFIGTRTKAFAEMTALYRDVFLLQPIVERQGAACFEADDGTSIHVYAEDDGDHQFFGTGPVVGFVVHNFNASRDAMLAAGIGFIGEPQRDGGTVWNHYRGPDGNICELIGGGRASGRPPGPWAAANRWTPEPPLGGPRERPAPLEARVLGRPEVDAPGDAPRPDAPEPEAPGAMDARLDDRIREHFAAIGRDEERAGSIYADDAVLEYVQSGERIRGRSSIVASRRAYPGRPAAFDVVRIVGSDAVRTAELILRIAGDEPHAVVAILDIRGGLVVRERIYIAEPWEPAAYRARWAETIAVSR